MAAFLFRIYTKSSTWVSQMNSSSSLSSPGSRSSSSSNSHDSFYSFHPEFRQEESLDMPTCIPYDFLGLAATNGLYRYVQWRLESRRWRLDSEEASYLLACAITFPRNLDPLNHILNSSQLLFECMSQMLDTGADPNKAISGTTTWSRFLAEMFHAKFRINCGDGRHVLHAKHRVWAGMARKFLEYEAIVEGYLRLADDGKITTFCIDAVTPFSVVYSFEFSPLYIFQICLKDMPGSVDVRELCIARGGRLHSKCTWFSTSSFVNSIPKKIYEMTERQSDDFLEAFEPWFHDDEVSQEMKSRLARHIEKINEELDVDMTKSDSSSDVLTNSSSTYSHGSE